MMLDNIWEMEIWGTLEFIVPLAAVSRSLKPIVVPAVSVYRTLGALDVF
jgi:hypothetical protein